MLFKRPFCNPCLLPADSSLLSCVPTKPSTSIKSFLRCRTKKHSKVISKRASTRKFQRINGSNIVREVYSNGEYRSQQKTVLNYDMTIFHDDELDNTQLAMFHRRKKQIPHWAQKHQLQLAIINQVYFQDKDPDDIFGCVSIEHVLEMINSIDFKNKEPMSMIVSRHFV